MTTINNEFDYRRSRFTNDIQKLRNNLLITFVSTTIIQTQNSNLIMNYIMILY